MGIAVTIAAGTRAWHVTDRSRTNRAFRAARRHSRWVRVLRLAIPLGVIIGVSSYALLSWFNPLNALARLPSGIKVSISGSKITMDLPRLAGFTRDGRSYELTASAAAQDLKRPHLIELKEIRAKVELQDGSLINVVADAGLYDTRAEAVALNQNILMTASTGYEVRLTEAKLDMRKGTILSEQPVAVLLSTGRIDAKQLEVTDSGDLIRFRGGVIMVLNSIQPAAEGREPPR